MSINHIYPDRFLSNDINKNKWVKVLAIPDRKNQTAELIELQSLLNSQQGKSFSYLNYIYNIVKGLRITFIESIIINENSFNRIHLSSGQVYLDSSYGSFFIDIDSQELLIPKIEEVRIGILIKFVVTDQTQKVIEEYNDPISGGEVTGSIGSDRLLVNYSIVINEDSYPIAVIQNNITDKPLVLYYINRKLNKQYNLNKISFRVEKYLKQRWFEEVGNFIAKGFNINYSTNFFHNNEEVKGITISPGTAYILGSKISLSFSSHLLLPVDNNPTISSTHSSSYYLILLNETGDIKIETNLESYKREDKQKSIVLGSLIVNKLIDQTSIEILKENDYKIFDSPSRILSVAAQTFIKEQNRITEAKFLQLALDQQKINEAENNNINLSGVFTDSLLNLNRCDIFSPLFSCSYMPAIQAIRLGYSTSIKDVTNLNIISSNGVIRKIKEGKSYYNTIDYTESIYIEQSFATNWLSLSLINTSNNSAVLVLSPDHSISESSLLYASSSLPTIQASLLNSLKASNPNNQVVVQRENKLRVREITADCFGFKPNEDNLVVTFGNIRITQFTLLNNTPNGSSFSSIKAKPDGTISFKFNIPPNLPSSIYVINVTNNISSASNIYKSKNIDNEKLVEEVRDSLPEGISTNSIGLHKGVSQSFYIDQPITISSIGLKLRNVTISAADSKVLFITLVKANNSIPSEEVIGVTTISSNDINLSNLGTSWSIGNFDKPLAITSPGEYAIIVTPFVEGIELFYSQVNNPELSSGNTSSNQALFNGNLCVKNNNVWQPKLDIDLCVVINKVVPSVLSGEIVYEIKDVETFNALDVYFSKVLPLNTSVDLFVQENNIWRLVEQNNIQLQQEANSTLIKLQLNGNKSFIPLVELDSASIITTKNNKNSSYISKTVVYEKEYKNIDFTFDCYIPNGSNLIPLFSSNKGQSWEPLVLTFSEIIDNNIPLQRLTYSARNLSNGINIDNIVDLRKRLTLRIDFSTNNTSIVPFAQRLSSIVY